MHSRCVLTWRRCTRPLPPTAASHALAPRSQGPGEVCSQPGRALPTPDAFDGQFALFLTCTCPSPGKQGLDGLGGGGPRRGSPVGERRVLLQRPGGEGCQRLQIPPGIFITEKKHRTAT